MGNPNCKAGQAVLRIEGKATGKNGSAIVTVTLGDYVIDCRTLNLTKPKERDAFVGEICNGQDSINRADVEERLIRLAVDLHQPKQNDRQPDTPIQDPERLLAEMPESVREEARLMLDDPNLMKLIIDDIETLGVAGERELTATIYLVGVSRLLDRPMAAIAQGPTASGKSFVIEKVAELFPPEAVVRATQQTPQALFHLPPGSLSYRFIVAGERSRREDDDSAEATRALREMISSGRLSKLIPMKVGGRIETQLVEQNGPISYVESTTSAKIFDEDANRCLLLHTDERPGQTRRVVDRVAADFSGCASPGSAQIVIERHHALQRMLVSWPVVIPYARRLAELFTSDRVEARRAFPQLMSMIQSITLLHQRQRPLNSSNQLVATPDDYQLAHHLLAGPMSRALGGSISEPARRFFDRLVDRSAVGSTFSTTEVSKGETASRRAVTGWLSELAEPGVVEQVEAHKGNKPAVWMLTKLTPDDVHGDTSDLPAIEDVFPEDDFRHSDSM